MSVKDFFLSNKKRTGVIISTILLFAGLIPLIICTFFADPAHPYTITQTSLITEDYVELKAHIYTPENMTGNHPGIVIGHGFTGNSRHMQAIAIELVKREFVVVNLNFRGHGNSGGHLPPFINPDLVPTLVKDMRAGIDYLLSLGVDRIGLVGHSMGSMTALATCERYPNEINATVIIGMAAGLDDDLSSLLGGRPSAFTDYNLSRVKNMLIANGRLEQMFTPDITLNFLAEYTNQSGVQFNTLYGDFNAGNASKAILGAGEHLFEPLDRNIIYETVAWFELAFYGYFRWDITLNAVYNQVFFALALGGMIALCFIAILYLHNFLWKNQPTNPQKDLVKDASLIKLIIGYCFAMTIGAGFLVVGLFMFGEILPVSLGELLYGIAVGTGVGSLVMYYLLFRKSENIRIKDIPYRIKKVCSVTYQRSILYGLIAAGLFATGIAMIADWSTVITIPTLREFGAIFGIAILLFPWILLKEFYFRIVQSKLKFVNRFKEYFSMVGIGFLMDSALIIVLMLLTWGHGPGIGFIALALFVVTLFSFIQQVLVTWVYMYSGRNILGSTIFLCLFYAWMIINFYPFGLALF